jgi:multicomponent Na+:H+ antiporter subunit B
VTRRQRSLVLALGLVGLAVVLWVGLAGVHGSGTQWHPYGDRSVAAALAHTTSNVVSSVNFDQRALDTFGEEAIFFAAVIGTVAVLDADEDEVVEETDVERPAAQPLAAVRVAGYLMLPVTVLLGIYVVAHGAVTPGGGFQGGIVLGTAVHVIYLAGDYDGLEAARPEPMVEAAKAVGLAGFAAIGVIGIAAGAGFLANYWPYGTLRALTSAGTVEPLNVATGLEVSAGVALLLSRFLQQVLRVRKDEVS